MAKLTYASLYFSSPASTPLSAATPAKAEGTTVSMQLADFEMDANNRLTYRQANTRVFDVVATLGLEKGSGSETLGTLHIYKNGSAVTGALTDLTFENTTYEYNAALAAQISLSENDYIEVWLETVNGDDVTVQSGTLSASVAG